MTDSVLKSLGWFIRWRAEDLSFRSYFAFVSLVTFNMFEMEWLFK